MERDWLKILQKGWDYDRAKDLRAENSLEVLQEAIRQNGKPEIVNSDQGSQFKCSRWVEYLKCEGILISMDGR